MLPESHSNYKRKLNEIMKRNFIGAGYASSFSVMLLLFLMAGCGDFLDIRPDKKMVIANTLDDVQAIFDNTGVLKTQANVVEALADSYYYTEADFNAETDQTRQLYAWNIPAVDYKWGWSTYYKTVFYVNEVISAIEEITYPERDAVKAQHLKGSALFVRALTYFHLAQLYAVPYVDATAVEEKGLPLRLTPDFNQVVNRSNLFDTYNQVIADFKEAIRLLPEGRTTYPTRPWKASAYAGLANVYLIMDNYALAGSYADSALQYCSTLMDFNELDTESDFPFDRFNPEVLYYSNFGQVGQLSNRILNVDTVLYASYTADDLRKSLYFKLRENQTIQYKGDYSTQNEGFFNGLTVAEMYLVRAECRARMGELDGAMDDLRTLLNSRWASNAYEMPDIADGAGLLDLILTERRKELVLKGRRWYDIRRLYKNPDEAITLTRNAGENTYRLNSADREYNTFNIPDEVSQLGSYTD